MTTAAQNNSVKTSASSERFVALTLRVGAYASFGLLLLSIVLALLARADVSLIFAKAGIIFLMATPTVRIVAAVMMYIAARDKKMILVSVGVLTIVVVSSLLGLKLY